MKKPSIPEPVLHQSPLIRDEKALLDQHTTAGARATDWVATVVGSWPFILGQSAMLILRFILTVTALIQQWDLYLFIIMNLDLSLLASFISRASVMIQNQQAAIDRFKVHVGGGRVWQELFPAVDGHDCPAVFAAE